jgi:hypothetical protein
LPKNHIIVYDTLITRSDSVTRSVIDPFLIAAKNDLTVNESNQKFFNFHLLPIINSEKQRENYHTVKTLSSNKETKPSKYYFEGGSDWLIFFIVFLVVLLVWIRIYYGKVIIRTFESTINQQSARKLIDERSNLLQKATFFLTLLYILSSGLFIFELISFFHLKIFDFKGFALLSLCTITLFLFFIIKSFFYWFTGILVKSEKESYEFISNGNIFYKSTGIILLPIVSAIPYVPDNIAQILLYSGIAVFIASFIMRVIRGFVISFQFKLSFFYSFLYFCALEILPVIYVYHFIKNVF